MNFTYNQAGQLATATRGANTTQYTYDAFGRRVGRVGAITATTLYQYDVRNRLIEETDGQNNPAVDYIYLDSLPVATISPVDNQVYFLHTDRIGTPQLATDSGQNNVWAGNGADPFGSNFILGGIVQNLGLPGQEFDVETGLAHNGFRDYIPGLGRYLQSDPIGLAGGMNTYAYVRGNPLRSIDPLGLCSLSLPEGVVPEALSADLEKVDNIEDAAKAVKAFYDGATASDEDIQKYLSGPHNPSLEDAAELAGIAYNLASYQPPPVTYTQEEWQTEYSGANVDYLLSRYLALKNEVANLASVAQNSGVSYIGSDASNQLSAVEQVLISRGYQIPQ